MAQGRSSDFPPRKAVGKTYRLDVPPNVLRARASSPTRLFHAQQRSMYRRYEECTISMTKITDRLFATYISPDRKVLDMDSFKAAMVKALSDAYEQGLQDGLATKATGPDA